MTNQADKLLPCPHCGGNACFDSEHDPDGCGVFYAIRCSKCNARSRQHYVSHGNDCPQFRAEVRDSWNRRQSAAATPIVDLSDRLKQEAQIHAQEARTANATIAEIYQLVTGATGEPGNWHGAEPVRAYIAEQRKLMQQALEALTDSERSLEVHGLSAGSFTRSGNAAAIAALRSRLDGEKK